MSKIKNSSFQCVSLDSLVKEANDLFALLDTISSSISNLENGLCAAKAHFSFKFELEKSISKALPLQPHHKKIADSISSVEGAYVVETVWFLQWDRSENKNGSFRLFLSAEETDVILSELEGRPFDYRLETTTTGIFKKPFIETSLDHRLKYTKYLQDFIDAFKNYLHEYRISIEKNPTEDIFF